MPHEGACLCGDVTYRLKADPLWVTICHCRFCQRATGSDRMIQPVVERADLAFDGTAPATYTQPSTGSGKDITVHFCPRCGTKLALSFARWPDKAGLYIGTLDNPAAIDQSAPNCKHIFVAEALPGTIIPPGVKAFDRHAADADGTPLEPVVHAAPFVVPR